MATPDILQRIIATTREETSRRRNAVSEAKVRAQALAKEPARGFADALQRRVAARRPAVIAEV